MHNNSLYQNQQKLPGIYMYNNYFSFRIIPPNHIFPNTNELANELKARCAAEATLRPDVHL